MRSIVSHHRRSGVFLDLVFPVRGEQVPTDHDYALYAALSRIVPQFHDKQSGLRFLPLNGVPAAPRMLQVTDRSRLRVRLSDDQIRLALPLAGKRLDLDGHGIR